MQILRGGMFKYSIINFRTSGRNAGIFLLDNSRLENNPAIIFVEFRDFLWNNKYIIFVFWISVSS